MLGIITHIMMVPGDGTAEPVCFTARESDVGPPQILNRLLGVVQELSLARDLAAIMEIVRVATQELTGAEGRRSSCATATSAITPTSAP